MSTHNAVIDDVFKSWAERLLFYSEEERQQCQSIASSLAWPRLVSAGIDAAGRLHIHKLDAARSVPMEGVISTERTTFAPSLQDMPDKRLVGTHHEEPAPFDELPISYLVQIDGKPAVLEGSVYRRRLESATLRRQHLGSLKSAEVKLHAALNTVFEAEDNNSASCTSAREDIVNFVQRMDNLVKDLQQAIPLLQPNMTLLDLQAMWTKVTQAEIRAEGIEEAVMQQLRSFMRLSPSKHVQGTKNSLPAPDEVSGANEGLPSRC